MSDPQSTTAARQKTNPDTVVGGVEESATAALPANPAVPSPPPVPVEKLTPEEQMALFEKSLKEEDWGHQPC